MTTPQRVAHWLILAVLGTGFLAAIYMVYVVYAVPGQGPGPMFGAAHEIDQDHFVRRRMYALEAWMTFGFLSIYLALTWLRPRPSAED